MGILGKPAGIFDLHDSNLTLKLDYVILLHKLTFINILPIKFFYFNN